MFLPRVLITILQVVMKNNIALSYFIDYMTAIGCQYFVFFYLNIEGWKVRKNHVFALHRRNILWFVWDENRW